ncbi:myotubularin-related protein 6-like [Lethenteron reissneri]|uniref:myotubularin-related protein 6-like n=1 Tax=Lethenteron reissneri TaxID=7753 RepID=UPI002AB72A82|nr:myotubularin-related protein 6-like [Lethenteron reissneri]
MEHIRTPKVEDVQLLGSGGAKPIMGTLYMTATHLIFAKKPSLQRADHRETWLAHSLLASLEKLPPAGAGGPLLLLHTKTFRSLHLKFQCEQDCQDVQLSLVKLCRPAHHRDLFAFSYSPRVRATDREEGWTLLDLRSEFRRMGVPNKHWKLTDINANYEVCGTYPADLFVPCVSTDIVLGSAGFRSKARFPTLSYLHAHNGAAICRCSQPLSGFSARCAEDEQLLQAVWRANPGPGHETLYVVDTRPKLNAMANRAAGRGYENEENYANIRFEFLGIENIHVMRSSLAKLLDVSQARGLSQREFVSGLEASGWLRHVQSILQASTAVASAVCDKGVSVLVHCSDGWDRTAQVCSVAGILLDPYYRTLRGFLVLIEKEWISFGHKFSQRCGFVEGDAREVSPVFLQLLECVWQLSLQFPCAFEFSERLLTSVHAHAQSCQFGNFLGNCERERAQLRVKEKTYSLWAFLWDKREEFYNPLYRADHRQNRGVLKPNLAPQCFRFWRGMFDAQDGASYSRPQVTEAVSKLQQKTQILQGEVTEMEKTFTGLGGTLPKQRSPSPIGAKNRKAAAELTRLMVAPEWQAPGAGGGGGGTWLSAASEGGKSGNGKADDSSSVHDAESDWSAQNSDQESGIADVSRSSPNGEDGQTGDDTGGSQGRG